VNVWSVEYEQFEDFAAIEDFQDPEQFPELVEGMSSLHSRYYNMHFHYTVFTYCHASILQVRLFKDFLVLFIICLDQPGFTLCWVALARALPWFRVV
jgi:hypothetical protein